MDNKIIIFLKSTGIKLLLVGVALIGIFLFLQDKNSGLEKTHLVSEHDVEQVVLLSGSVKAVGQVDLSFDSYGKVATTTVLQGDLVSAGEILAELDYQSLRAEYLQAQGNVLSAQSKISSARATVQKAEANLSLVQAQNRGTDSSVAAAETLLANTINEQETLVRNAYQELLNNNLEAYPVDNNRSVPSPVISGSYISDESGEYTLDFYASNADTGYSVKISGLEKNTISFKDYGTPVFIGTSGLYITLPESGNGYSYSNTDWVIPVPNNRSATYQTKLSAYNKAKQTQTQAVTNAQSNLTTLLSQQASGERVAITTAQEQQALASLQEAEANLNQAVAALAQAEAGVAKVQAQINNSIITAPFAGRVARLNIEVGQSVTAGYPSITVVTDGDYELVMSIPEIDVAKVKVGDEVKIILDAYGNDVVWSGELTEIELVETEVDGVPVYLSKITIIEPDNRIKIGMNARARIVVKEQKNVVAVPTSYINKSGDTSTVLVKINDRQIDERVVSTGLVGTDFFAEVTEGLSAGETIIYPTEK